MQIARAHRLTSDRTSKVSAGISGGWSMRLTFTAVAAVAMGCGSEGPEAPMVTPPAPRAERLSIAASRTSLTVSDTVTLTGTVVDQYGVPMPSVPISWQVLGNKVIIVERSANAIRVTAGGYVGDDSVEAIAVVGGTESLRANTRLQVGAPQGAMRIEIRIARWVGEPLRSLLLAAADSAARRWQQVVLDEFPSGRITFGPNGGCYAISFDEPVNGLLVLVDTGYLAPPGVAHAKTCARHANGFPAVGYIRATSRADDMPGKPYLLMLHEFGHLLGIGSADPRFAALQNESGPYSEGRHFTGPNATAAVRALGTAAERPSSTIQGVPIAPDLSHWDSRLVQTPEGDSSPLLADVMAIGSNVISRITIGALWDLGYSVNMNAANYYNPRDLYDR